MKVIEKYVPLLLGAWVSYLFFKHEIVNYSDCNEFIKQFTTIGTCAFGFLLTLFGLIIQSDSDIITEIRKRKIPYKRFIFYNRKVVFISLSLTIYSYILGYLDWNSLLSSHDKIPIIMVSIFFGGFCWFLIEVIYFLIIFYILIQDKNDTIQ